MVENIQNPEFQAIALDVWNGSTAQVRNFQQQTGFSFPICTKASGTGAAYQVANHYSVVVDQNGIIQYTSYGADTSIVGSVIRNLLTPVSITPKNKIVPDRFILYQNYPNPFNPDTHIRFSIPVNSTVSLRIFDSRGMLVRTLVNRRLNAGPHQSSWDGTNEKGQQAASGIYYYILKNDYNEQAKKMILLR